MFAMFSAHALREKRGIPIRHAHTNVTTFTYFGQNWIIGCLLAALLSIQLNYEVVLDNFFSAWCSGLLDNKVSTK